MYDLNKEKSSYPDPSFLLVKRPGHLKQKSPLSPGVGGSSLAVFIDNLSQSQLALIFIPVSLLLAFNPQAR